MGEKDDQFGELFKPSWYRGGRLVDVSGFPIDKLVVAAEERGLRIDLVDSPEGKEGTWAKVYKIAVKGDDEP